MTTCNEICLKHKVSRSNSGSPYELGLKHCKHCGVFMRWKGTLCPCCNTKLRRNPRTKSQKENLRKKLSRKNIKNKALKSIISAASFSAITGICINHGLQHMFHSISNVL